MKKKRSSARIFQITGAGFIAAVGIYVYCGWFFPVSPFFFGDDWFVLPERVWFPDKWDWLRHLLFFNQTRFTYVGDFLLFRPGVFLWIWIQDILFRDNRLAMQYLLMLAATVVLYAGFRMVKEFCGTVLALIGCIFILAYPQHGLLYTWPHISGYMAALGFYTWAMRRYLAEPKSKIDFLLIGGLLFLAELFQEFVAITISFLIVWEFLYLRKHRPKNANRRLLTLTVSLAAFFAMIGAVYLRTRPPQLLFDEESRNVTFGLDHFFNVCRILGNVLLRILSDTLPIPTTETTLSLAISYSLGSVAVLYFIYLARKMPKTKTPYVWVMLLPVLAIFAGFTASRINIRGAISPWYYEMIRYYLVMAALIVWPSEKKWTKPTYVLAGAMLITSVFSAYRGHLRNAEKSMESDRLIPLIRSASEYFSSSSKRCYNGMISSEFNSALNQILNIVLQKKSCGWQAGEPTYARLSLNTPPEGLPTKALSPKAQWQSAVLGLGPEVISEELRSYLEPAPYNLLEARKGQHHPGTISIRWNLDQQKIQQLRASFRSQDEFPQMNGIGVALRAGDTTKYFIFSENHILLFQQFGADVVQLTLSPIPKMQKEFSLRLTDFGSECFVFYGDFLLTRTMRCFEKPVQIGVFTYDNASALETIESLEVSE